MKKIYIFILFSLFIIKTEKSWSRKMDRVEKKIMADAAKIIQDEKFLEKIVRLEGFKKNKYKDGNGYTIGSGLPLYLVKKNQITKEENKYFLKKWLNKIVINLIIANKKNKNNFIFLINKKKYNQKNLIKSFLLFSINCSKHEQFLKKLKDGKIKNGKDIMSLRPKTKKYQKGWLTRSHAEYKLLTG